MGSSPKSKEAKMRDIENIKARYESQIAWHQSQIGICHQHKLTESDKRYIQREKAEIAKLKARMKEEIARAKASN